MPRLTPEARVKEHTSTPMAKFMRGSTCRGVHRARGHTLGHPETHMKASFSTADATGLGGRYQCMRPEATSV